MVHKFFYNADVCFYWTVSQSRAPQVWLKIDHGHAPDDEKKVLCEGLTRTAPEHMQKFLEAHGAKMAESGHILETTVSGSYGTISPDEW